MKLITVIDGFGVYGSTLHYALVIAFVGSAFILFAFFWKKGRLDMDEEPKFQMMENDQGIPEEISMSEELHGKTK
jgi:hypothetical protein